MKKIFSLMAMLISLNAVWSQQAVLTPLSFGFLDAQTPEARYWVLQKTHAAAKEKDAKVTYQGLGDFEITIPMDAVPIELTSHTDFGGVTITVTNNSKDMPLFRMANSVDTVVVDKSLVDDGDFSSIPQLAQGLHLLVLYDQNPWVAERIGYSYPAMRRDVLLVRDGKSINRPVASYATESTHLRSYYCDIDDRQKVIENLNFVRAKGSKMKTYCLSFANQNNVLVRDVTIVTPKSRLTADGAIAASNCTQIRLEDVTIDGTYSVSGKYGYGISFNNVWNSSFVRLVADGAWGVFGTNNMSKIELIECDVNRFDIHCYGRDVVCKRCLFRNKQTQFGSFYGSLVFDSCQFVDCIPVRIRSSYNAYTPFDILFKDCTFEATRRYHSLVNVMLLDTNLNARPELAEKCWPNIVIDNMVVSTQNGVTAVNIIDPTGTLSECKKPVGYLSNIAIKDFRFVRKGQEHPVKWRLSSRQITTKLPLKLTMEGVSAAVRGKMESNISCD